MTCNINNVHTTTILLEQTRGGAQGGGFRLRGVSPRGSWLVARGSSRVASPRVASPRLEKSSRPAVTLTVAAAVAVTVAVAFRSSGYVLRCVSRKEREREPGVSREYILVPHPSPRPAGRQDPDCRPVPTPVILTRTISLDCTLAVPAIPAFPHIFLVYSTGLLLVRGVTR